MPNRALSSWRRSLRLAVFLLALWALAGVGLGIVLVPALDEVRIGGFRLGFWWAQQGSILAFVGIVWLNAVWMDRLDARADVHSDAETSVAPSSTSGGEENV